MQKGLRWVLVSVVPVVLGVAVGLVGLWVELGQQGIDVRSYLP